MPIMMGLTLEVSTLASAFATGAAIFCALGVEISLTTILSDLPSAMDAGTTLITVDSAFAVSTLVSGLGASGIIALFAACAVSVTDIP